jgi:hypothetical protein
LAEIISIRGGSFEDGPAGGGRRFTSTGWGIRLSGIPKLLRVVDKPVNDDDLLGYLINHVDIRYSHSAWTGVERNSLLTGRTFDAINISLSI